MGELEADEARMKFEWYSRRAARDSNAPFGRRDIASLLNMTGIYKEFRGAFLVFEWAS